MDLFLKRSGVEAKFYDLCSQVAKTLGYELYDLEYLIGAKILRLYILNPMTKTALIEDCVKMDEALSPYFETETWMPQEITLEVSSPGIYRNLRTLDHFKMVSGSSITVVLNKNLAGDAYKELPKSITGQKKLTGKLKNISEDKIELEVNNFEFPIKMDDVKKANLEA